MRAQLHSLMLQCVEQQKLHKQQRHEQYELRLQIETQQQQLQQHQQKRTQKSKQQQQQHALTPVASTDPQLKLLHQT